MSDQIKFSDFQKLDIRVGTVVEAVVPDWSHWVMKLIVDFGPEAGRRTIFAGIMKHFQAEELVGRQFPFVTNLEPKKIGPKEADGKQNYSEGMMLVASVTNENASDDTEETPVLFKLWREVPNGTKVR